VRLGELRSGQIEGVTPDDESVFVPNMLSC